MSDIKHTVAVKIGGSKLSKDAQACMESVIIRDSLEHIDLVEVSFSLIGEQAETVAKEVAKYGDPILVELQENGSPVRTVGGDIVSINWSRRISEVASVTVTGLDPRHRLKKPRASTKKGDRRWVGKKASEIVEDIAKSWSFGTDVQSTNAAIKVFEHYGDDAAIIKHLADENGYVMRVDMEGGSPTLIFARREQPVSGADVTLNYGEHVQEFEIDHNLTNIVTKVKVAGFNPITGDDPVFTEAAKSKVSAMNDKTGIDFVSKAWGEFPEVISETDGGRGVKSETQDKAEGILKARAMTFVSGTLHCILNPNVRSGSIVTLKGAGWPMDGKYVVGEVKHVVEQGNTLTLLHVMSDSIKAP